MPDETQSGATILPWESNWSASRIAAASGATTPQLTLANSRGNGYSWKYVVLRLSRAEGKSGGSFNIELPAAEFATGRCKTKEADGTQIAQGVRVRIAIVSDIHGNLTGLEAVLADLRATSPDVVLQGGDLAANAAHPAEVVDRVRELGWRGVRGNTDEMLWKSEGLTELATKFPKLRSILANFAEMIPWTCAQLGEDRIRWLERLPIVERHSTVALLHASPASLWQAPLPGASDRELLDLYRGQEASIAVYGHIHRPFVRRLEGMTVANSGSVSLSYDGDRRASYLLVDEDAVAIRRVEYDLESEASALAQSGLPHAEWLCRILRAGRYHPPT